MIQAYNITAEQAEILIGKICYKDVTFKPVEDIKGNWFISIEEHDRCTNYRYRDILASATLSELVHPPNDIVI